MCGFWMQNSDFRTRITSLCRWIDPTCGFCMQNNDFWTRITSLWESQTSPVIFCMQNSVPSIRIASLHGSQSSSVVFGCKTAAYGPEKQVSMGCRHDLSPCEWKTALLASDLLVSMCPNPHLCFFWCNTAHFGPEFQVSMGPRPHLWFWAHITASLTQE